MSRGCVGFFVLGIAWLMAGSAACTPQRLPELRLDFPHRITQNRTFSRQVIHVKEATDAGALVIETDGVTLDLGGAELVGASEGVPADAFVGRGIVVRGAKSVTIRNAVLRGFKIGIYAEDAHGLRIENCDVSGNYRQHLKSTPQREDVSDWLYAHKNDDDQWLRYGAGMYLKHCEGAAVLNNRARSGQNGLCLVRCDEAEVAGNDMSFMSGWGLAMWRSSRCRVLGNRFDYCVRGYSDGAYARGQDSAGILVYEQCSDNVFAYNRATHGGDGFFLYAGNETLERTGEGGCNRNLIYMNDFSHAVANGIEATFSDRNVFVGNLLRRCTHGIWAGYSRNSLIGGNEITDCNNGISIEHGSGNRIIWNYFEKNTIGVRLWWDEDTKLLASAYGQRYGGLSRGERVRFNHFVDCEAAIRAADSTELEVSGNACERCREDLHVDGTTTIKLLRGNVFDGGTVVNHTSTGLTGVWNHLPEASGTDGAVTWEQPASDSLFALVAAASERADYAGERVLPEERQLALAVMERWGSTRRTLAWTAATRDSSAGVLAEGVPQRPAGGMPGPLPNVPEGKANIIVDEWGPYDYAAAKLHPPGTTSWGSHVINILGQQAPFEVESVRGDVSVTPQSGTAPGRITISRTAEEAGASPYALRVRVGQAPLEAQGAVLGATWEVYYYAWSPDADPRAGEDAWRVIVNSDPVHFAQSDKIDFVWHDGSPSPDMMGDYFAVMATTSFALPAGRWRLWTVSDDGVRVEVDEERVIDNWTWHVPTEDSAVVDLSDGPHTFRIEYFEITGHAQLRFFIEPAGASSMPAVEH